MAVDYNPSLPHVIADPYPVFHRLRAEDPVHWSGILGGWVLTRYSDVKGALTDPRLSADRITPFLKHQAKGGRSEVLELGRRVGMWAVFTDPPAHTRLRGLMNKAFTPRAVELVRPRIQEIVDELIDRVRNLGRMDVIRDVAYPLPVTVIAEMLGVPKEDRERLKTWSDELALFIGSALATPDKYERAGHSIIELSEYFRSLIAARRAHAHDDMLSALIAAEERGAGLSEDELVATCVLLLFAGHETTTNLIGNGLLALLRDSNQLEVLRAEPSLAPLAVEELLRYDGPTQAMVRVAAEDMKIGDKRIKRGDRIFAIINAANRDPAQFADPDRLDLRREPNRHIAFGFGIHFCIGAPLARLEGQIAFATLLGRLSDLELLTTAPEWLDSVVFRGVKSLPVSFRVAHPPRSAA